MTKKYLEERMKRYAALKHDCRYCGKPTEGARIYCPECKKYAEDNGEFPAKTI